MFPMVDRDPIDRWTFGRVTLLGDAAHPMWPISSNGASQAVLDCRCLADRLAEHGDVDGAFSAYEAERRPATAAVVLANRANAHDEVLEIAERRAERFCRHPGCCQRRGVGEHLCTLSADGPVRQETAATGLTAQSVPWNQRRESGSRGTALPCKDEAAMIGRANGNG